MVERLAEGLIVKRLEPGVVRKMIETVAGIALGNHALHGLQAIDKGCRQDIARAVAFALLDGGSQRVLAAVNDADDASALGRVKVLRKRAELKFRAATPVVHLERSAA